MRVWILSEGEYDGERVRGVYTSVDKAMAACPGDEEWDHWVPRAWATIRGPHIAPGYREPFAIRGPFELDGPRQEGGS